MSPDRGCLEETPFMKTIRLTMAQALTRFLARQMTEVDGRRVPLIAGVWAIFGHGNVAGMGEALSQLEDALPTFRGHNEQAMAHAADAFATPSFPRRALDVPSSIGPGSPHLVTQAALPPIKRQPLLLPPRNLFAHRPPPPPLPTAQASG